jgi:uncharacterized protein with NRDE domain
MCTVTYIPTNEGFILTSNRDEKVHRPTIKPAFYEHPSGKILYPKDVIAGGTWIATNSRRTACLLNGAFEKHTKQSIYSKSRGQVLLESFDYDNLAFFVENCNLLDVEPFTLLLIDTKNHFSFVELVWDGTKKHISEVNQYTQKIWSSATLYSQEDRILRNNWFDTWLLENQDSTDFKILEFHKYKHSDNLKNNILAEKNQELKTVSISQFQKNSATSKFNYLDLLDESTLELLF